MNEKGLITQLEELGCCSLPFYFGWNVNSIYLTTILLFLSWYFAKWPTPKLLKFCKKAKLC